MFGQRAICGLGVLCLLTACSRDAVLINKRIEPEMTAYHTADITRQVDVLLSEGDDFSERFFENDTLGQITNYLINENRHDDKAWEALNLMMNRLDGEYAEAGLDDFAIYFLDRSDIPQEVWFNNLRYLKECFYGSSYRALLDYEVKSCRSHMEGWLLAYNYCKNLNEQSPKGYVKVAPAWSFVGLEESARMVQMWRTMMEHFENRLAKTK